MRDSIEVRVVCPKGKNLDYPLEHQLQPFLPEDVIPPFAVSNPVFIDGDAAGVWTTPFAEGAFAGE